MVQSLSYFAPKQYSVPSVLPITSRPSATAGEAVKSPPASYSHNLLAVLRSRPYSRPSASRRTPGRRRPPATSRLAPCVANFHSFARRRRIEARRPACRGRRRSRARRSRRPTSETACLRSDLDTSRRSWPLFQSMAKNARAFGAEVDAVAAHGRRRAGRARRSRPCRSPSPLSRSMMCSLPSQPARNARSSTTVGEQRI